MTQPCTTSQARCVCVQAGSAAADAVKHAPEKAQELAQFGEEAVADVARLIRDKMEQVICGSSVELWPARCVTNGAGELQTIRYRTGWGGLLCTAPG